MSFKTKIAAAALIAVTSLGAIAASASQAEAKGPGPHFGVAAGLIGAAVVGSAIAANSAYYVDDYGYRRCGWVPRYDVFGNYRGRVRACAW